MEKKDISFLREYDAAETTTGTPKYYAMSGGATGAGAASSGKITIVPTPSSAFMYKMHYNECCMIIHLIRQTCYCLQNHNH